MSVDPIALCVLLVLLAFAVTPAQEAPPAELMEVGNVASCKCKKLEKERADGCEDGACQTCSRKVTKVLVPTCKNAEDTDCCVGKKGGTVTLPSGGTAKIKKQKGKKQKGAKNAFKEVLDAVAGDLGVELGDKERKELIKNLKPTHCKLVRQGNASGKLVAGDKVAYDLGAACTKAVMNNKVQGLTADHQKIARGAYMAVGKFAAGKESRHARSMEGLCQMAGPAPGPLSCRKGLGAAAPRPARRSGGSVPCEDLEGVDGLPSSVKARCGF